MDDWWPRLDEGVLAHLQRVFQTPLKLDAAFDNDEECLMMLNAEFPDMVAEDAMDSMTVLVLWKEAMSRPLKRARGELVRSSLFRLPLPGQLSVQEEFTRLTRTSAICILEMHVKQKQRRVKEDPADARAKRFEAERRKYSRLLAQVIEQAKLPIVELVKTLEDPRSAWLHLFAARRANTLKNRYKVWRPFEHTGATCILVEFEMQWTICSTGSMTAVERRSHSRSMRRSHFWSNLEGYHAMPGSQKIHCGWGT